jgi:hypothetical protein
VDLHVSITEKDVTDPVQLVALAMRLDGDLSLWVSEVPLIWRHRTITRMTTPKFYGDYCHSYQSCWIASVWNYYRLCRILVQKVVLQNLDVLFGPVSSTDPALASKCWIQHEKSRIRLSQFLDEIRASIPYQLGLDETQNTDSTLVPRSSGVISFLGLLQGLVTAMERSDMWQDWLLSTCEFIGGEIGIRQAWVMARSIREQSQTAEVRSNS